MQIRQLILENFQSHENTSINLHPNFNCLIGRNSSGKSSIVRALSFILYGNWDTTWVKEGAKFCRITLITDDGTEIVREKGSSVNKYILRIPNATEQVYESFGTSVPEQIEDVLKIRKIQIDAKDYLNLNVSNQHDGLFLIPTTGSFKAKVIGKLSDVHLLDYALREINKGKKNLSSEKRIKLQEKEQLDDDVKQYDYLENVEKRLIDVENKLNKVVDVENRLDKLKELLERTYKWKQDYVVIKYKTDALNVLQEDVMGKEIDRLMLLAKVGDSLNEVEKELNRCTDYEDYVTKEENKVLESYIQLLKDTGTCPSCFTELDKNKLEKLKTNL